MKIDLTKRVTYTIIAPCYANVCFLQATGIQNEYCNVINTCSDSCSDFVSY